MNMSLAHIEAGLRTESLRSPFPEEFNRRTISILSDLHFAPTRLSAKNLIGEGVMPKNIFVTGNTVIDALQYVINWIENDQHLNLKLGQIIQKQLPFDYEKDIFVLITGHRRENFGEGFAEICKAIRELAEENKSVHFVYPVHLNPNVLQPVNKALAGLKNVHLISPLSYLPFVYLMNLSYLVLTDLGGIQEEAPD